MNIKPTPVKNQYGHFDSAFEYTVFTELQSLGKGWQIERQIEIEILQASEYFKSKRYVCDFRIVHVDFSTINLYVEAKGDWAFRESESLRFLKLQLMLLAKHQPEVFENYILVTPCKMNLSGSKFQPTRFVDLKNRVRELVFTQLGE